MQITIGNKTSVYTVKAFVNKKKVEKTKKVLAIKIYEDEELIWNLKAFCHQDDEFNGRIGLGIAFEKGMLTSKERKTLEELNLSVMQRAETALIYSNLPKEMILEIVNKIDEINETGSFEGVFILNK